MTTRSRASHLGVPSEHHEMVRLAEFLDKAVGRYGWLHVPNEGKRSPRAGARLKAEGLKPGAPDVLIFRVEDVEGLTAGILEEPVTGDGLIVYACPRALPPNGIAVELKKVGSKLSAVSAEQVAFGESLASRGWYWFAAAGADAAIDELIRLGYGSER